MTDRGGGIALRCHPELRALDEQRASIVIPDEDNIADYYDLRQQLDILNKDLRDVLNHPTYALPFLQPGRLVRVKHDDLDFGWGVVVNYQKRVGTKVRKPLYITRRERRRPLGIETEERVIFFSRAGQTSPVGRTSAEPVHRRRSPPPRAGYGAAPSAERFEAVARFADQHDPTVPVAGRRRVCRRARAPLDARRHLAHPHLPRERFETARREDAGAQERQRGQAEVPRRDRAPRPGREHGHRRRSVQKTPPRESSPSLARFFLFLLSLTWMGPLPPRVSSTGAAHRDPRISTLVEPAPH